MTDEISTMEKRSLKCYDGVTRVMASLATQTDSSWLSEPDSHELASQRSHRHHRHEDTTTRHGHRSDGSQKQDRNTKAQNELLPPGNVYTHALWLKRVLFLLEIILFQGSLWNVTAY